MIIFRRLQKSTRYRIVIRAAVFFTAGPAPGTTASMAHMEYIIHVEAACEDVGTRSILETPSRTPRALLCIRGPFLFHLV
jgi:hypothetical protein